MPRLSIRRKLAVALAVPLTALILLTVLEVARTAQDAAEVAEQTELAKSAIGPSGIITALQNERSWLGVELVGQQDAVNVPVRGYDETRSQTDAAIEAFRDEVAGHSDVVAAAYGPALDGLEGLDEVRADIDSEPGPRDLSKIEFANGIFGRYEELIEPFFAGTSRVALVIDDPELRLGAELAEAVGREVEIMTLLLTHTINDATVSEGGIDQPAEIITIAMLQSDFQRYAAFLRDPSGPYAEVAEERFPEEVTARINEHVDSALATGRVDLPTLLADVDVPDDEAYEGYMSALHALITERADHVRSTAEARQLRFGLLAALALIGAIALTLLVSRSITRPLRSLTGQAKDMAERRLPGAVRDILETPLGDDVQVPHVEPVVVRTRDEVADVAAALNVVQESALDLAVEQAVLRRNIADSFVHLGRRNQNLLGRQLDFITELEANETDSEVLASLFRLDHLATRMRRNAESLLVLAGIEPPRKWVAPVRLTDVVRAALGEVEDFHRVTVRAVEQATVTGSVAADLAHLVAELLENSLTFSPPEEPVEVRGRHKREGGYHLAIVDRGTGMTPHDLTQANRRLAGTESFTVAPSKYLGHYVAGNLAARHGIALRLDPTPGHGITTSVELPPALLVDGDPATDGGAPAHDRPTPAPRRAPAPVAPPAPEPVGAAWAAAPAAGGAGPWAPQPAAGPATGGWSTGPAPAPGGAEPDSPVWAFLRTVEPGRGTGHEPGQRPAPSPPPWRSGLATPSSGFPGEPGLRPGPAPGPAAPGAASPARGGAAGLARRVPGAQLPTTEPLSLRRSGAAPDTGRARAVAPGGSPAPGSAPGRTDAQDVYGFLAKFTSGVQRGLDEARRDGGAPGGPV